MQGFVCRVCWVKARFSAHLFWPKYASARVRVGVRIRKRDGVRMVKGSVRAVCGLHGVLSRAFVGAPGK